MKTVMFELMADGTAEVMRCVWPGGYPVFYVCDDGGDLCPKCAQDNLELIGTASPGDGWNVIAFDVNWEDSHLYCDHCNDRIPSAHAEDEVTQ